MNQEKKSIISSIKTITCYFNNRNLSIFCKESEGLIGPLHILVWFLSNCGLGEYTEKLNIPDFYSSLPKNDCSDWPLLCSPSMTAKWYLEKFQCSTLKEFLN